MVDWTYLLLAQYPLFLLLSLYFLLRYMLVRKSSAVRSVLWVLLFGISLAVSVLFAFLGIHYTYWTFRTLFKLGVASWIGIALAAATLVARIVHLIEKKHNKHVMDKELEKAAREKEDAVALAHEEGRRAAHEETEALRLSQAVSDAKAEAEKGEFSAEANAPIELTLETPAEE